MCSGVAWFQIKYYYADALEQRKRNRLGERAEDTKFKAYANVERETDIRKRYVGSDRVRRCAEYAQHKVFKVHVTAHTHTQHPTSHHRNTTSLTKCLLCIWAAAAITPPIEWRAHTFFGSVHVSLCFPRTRASARTFSNICAHFLRVMFAET